jgi:molybdate transport system regulatory protein
MGRDSRNSDLTDRVTPRAKVWLEVNSQYVFGLGISEILKAIEHTGSIKAAAQEVGKSYRHVWDKIKQAEHALGVPLVRTQVGGKDTRRSELSPLAQDLVRDFEALRQRLFELVQVEFSQCLRDTLQKQRCDLRPPHPTVGKRKKEPAPENGSSGMSSGGDASGDP